MTPAQSMQQVLEEQGYVIIASLYRYDPGTVLDGSHGRDITYKYGEREQVQYAVVLGPATEEEYLAQMDRYFPENGPIDPAYRFFHRIGAE